MKTLIDTLIIATVFAILSLVLVTMLKTIAPEIQSYSEYIE